MLRSKKARIALIGLSSAAALSTLAFAPPALADSACSQGSRGQECIKWNASTQKMVSTFNNNKGKGNSVNLEMQERLADGTQYNLGDGGLTWVPAGGSTSYAVKPDQCLAQGGGFRTVAIFGDGTIETSGWANDC